jgi:hypothetical protein
MPGVSKAGETRALYISESNTAGAPCFRSLSTRSQETLRAIPLAILHLSQTFPLLFCHQATTSSIAAEPAYQARMPLNHTSHLRRHVLTQLSAIGASYSIAIPCRTQYRPSEVPTYPVSHVCCCSLDYRATIALTSMPGQNRDRCLTATSSNHRCRRSLCRRNWTDTRSPLLIVAKPLPLGLHSLASAHYWYFDFTLRPSKPGHQITGQADGTRKLQGRSEAFSLLVL